MQKNNNRLIYFFKKGMRFIFILTFKICIFFSFIFFLASCSFHEIYEYKEEDIKESKLNDTLINNRIKIETH